MGKKSAPVYTTSAKDRHGNPRHIYGCIALGGQHISPFVNNKPAVKA